MFDTESAPALAGRSRYQAAMVAAPWRSFPDSRVGTQAERQQHQAPGRFTDARRASIGGPRRRLGSGLRTGTRAPIASSRSERPIRRALARLELAIPPTLRPSPQTLDVNPIVGPIRPSPTGGADAARMSRSESSGDLSFQVVMCSFSKYRRRNVRRRPRSRPDAPRKILPWHAAGPSASACAP